MARLSASDHLQHNKISTAQQLGYSYITVYTVLKVLPSTLIAMLRSCFTYIYPFRRTLLQMLRPYDIAKLANALECELTKEERSQSMMLLDDVFQDTDELNKTQESGLRVHLFGTDTLLLQDRLLHPRRYLQRSSPFNVFVLVTAPVGNPRGTADFPSWIRINTSFEDINTFAYDYTTVGDKTPWIPISGRLISHAFGSPFNTDQKHLRMPCFTFQSGKLLYSLQNGNIFSGQLFHDAMQDPFFAHEGSIFVAARVEPDTYLVYYFIRGLNLTMPPRLPWRRWSY